ncbi:MAG: thioredoxin domain-containing protein [Gemmatimonadaceae bacterium]|nr:thioredoxin domain-containing protein [Gemmatimonadaceae bacterium]
MSAQVRKQSSNKGFLIALGAILVAGGAFIYWKMQQDPPAEVLVMPTVADSALAAKAHGYTIGSATAPVEIVEFADYECPACGNYFTLTEVDVRKNLVETGMVKYTFYDFPLLNAHQNTIPASMSAACADDQGKFWEMHDALFTDQLEWSGVSTSNPRGVITAYAQRIGLDIGKWNACMDAQTHAERIKANYALGLVKQVGSTPTFFVNGVKMVGAPPYDEMKAAVDSAAAKVAPAAATAPAPAAK